MLRKECMPAALGVYGRKGAKIRNRIEVVLRHGDFLVEKEGVTRVLCSWQGNFGNGKRLWNFGGI